MSAAKSTALLTAVSFFSQGVGFVYRVLLARMVGSEVMGLYQLVMPAFGVMMSLTAIGFTAACATLTARYRALGDRRAAHQVLRCCVVGFLGAFGVVAAVTVPGSDFISVRLLGDARAQLGLLLLLPCLLLTGIENLHKHAFYGAGEVRGPAFTEIAEQVIRTGAVLGLLWWFLPQNPERTVGLIVCGMVVCEIFSAVTLTLLYRRRFGREGTGGGISPAGMGRQIRHIALPVGWTSLLGNLMGAATAVIIPRRLVHAGADVPSAMSALGVLHGMTMPLLTLPTAFLMALRLVLLPRLSQSRALGRMEEFRARAVRAATAVAWLIIPSSALLAVLAPSLGRVLFHEPTAGQFALPLAGVVILSSFEMVFAVCLHGLGKQTVTARNSLICGAIELCYTWWRMGRSGVGLRGCVEAMVVGTALGLGLNWMALRRAGGIRLPLFSTLAAPGLSALLAALCVNLLLPILMRAGLEELTACVVCLMFGVVLYGAAMAAQGMKVPKSL